MKKLLTLLLLIPSLSWSMDYDDCILKYAKDANTKNAVSLVYQSCNFLYNLNKNQKWSKCILNNVPEAQVTSAVNLISKSCSKKFPKDK